MEKNLQTQVFNHIVIYLNTSHIISSVIVSSANYYLINPLINRIIFNLKFYFFTCFKKCLILKQIFCGSQYILDIRIGFDSSFGDVFTKLNFQVNYNPHCSSFFIYNNNIQQLRFHNSGSRMYLDKPCSQITKIYCI